jgi:hypothetical protein
MSFMPIWLLGDLYPMSILVSMGIDRVVYGYRYRGHLSISWGTALRFHHRCGQMCLDAAACVIFVRPEGNELQYFAGVHQAHALLFLASVFHSVHVWDK